MNEVPPCPYCSEPVADEGVMLWDDLVYCRACVNEVSPELYEYAKAGGRLEETVEKFDLSVKNYLLYEGRNLVIGIFCIVVIPLTILMVRGNAALDITLWLGIYFCVFGFVLICLKAMSEVKHHRKILPRTIRIKNERLLVVNPDDETRYMLRDCKWFLGSTSHDDFSQCTALRHGVVIHTPESIITCGHSSDMLKYWIAFLKLADVPLITPLSWQRVVLVCMHGIVGGTLLGMGLGYIASIMTNDNRWIFGLGLVGGIEGLAIACMYASRDFLGIRETQLMTHPAVWGLSFFGIGLKIGLIGGLNGALICGSINSIIGMTAAWFCRFLIRANELQFDDESQFVSEHKAGDEHGD